MESAAVYPGAARAIWCAEAMRHPSHAAPIQLEHVQVHLMSHSSVAFKVRFLCKQTMAKDDTGRNVDAELLVALEDECEKDSYIGARKAIEAGANVNLVDQNNGLTVLMIAATDGKIELVNYLLTLPNIDFDAKWMDFMDGDADPHGETALHLAAMEGKLEVVKALIQAGANPSIPDSNGKTVTDVLVDRVKNSKSTQISQIVPILNELCADRDLLLTAVKNGNDALRYAPYELRADREVVMAAVQNNGETLFWASDELRADRQVVLAAVKNNGIALGCALAGPQADHEVVLAAVTNSGCALWHASRKMCTDREVVLAAVTENGSALQYASRELCADREVVLTAVKHNGDSIHWASEELCADREVMLAAVKQSGWTLKYASFGLRADRKLVLAAVQKYGCALHWALGGLRLDRDVVLAAVKQNGRAFKDASDKLRSDREFVMVALQTNGNVLRWASDELRTDRELVALQSLGCMVGKKRDKSALSPDFLPRSHWRRAKAHIILVRRWYRWYRDGDWCDKCM